MLAADAATLTELLDADLVYTHSSGVVDSKSSYLDGLAAKVWEYLDIRREEERVLVKGAAALVFARVRITLKVRGTLKHLDNRSLAVWTLQEGGWRLLALQSSAVANG